MNAPTEVDAAARRFGLLYDSKRYAEALDVARGALAQSPDNADLLIRAAQAALQLYDVPGARSYAEQAMAADRSNPLAFLMGSLIARGQDRGRDAVDLAQQCVSLAPHYAQGYVQLAMGYLMRRESQDVAAARAAVERALELAPDDVGVLAEVAAFHIAVGERETALAFIDHALALAPQHVGLLTRRAEIMPDHEESLATLRGALADDPLNIDARTQVHARTWHLLNTVPRMATTMTIYGLLVGAWFWADGRIVGSLLLTILLTAIGAFAVIRALRGIGAAQATLRQSLRDGGAPARMGIVASAVAVVLWLAFAATSLTLSRPSLVPVAIAIAAATILFGSAAIILLLLGELRAAGRSGMLEPGRQPLAFFEYVATVGRRRTCRLVGLIVAASLLFVVGVVQGGALGVALGGIATGWLAPMIYRSWQLAARSGWSSAERKARAWSIAWIVAVGVLSVAAFVWAPRVLDADGVFDSGGNPAVTPSPTVPAIDSNRFMDRPAPPPVELPTVDVPPLPDRSQVEQLVEAP